MIAPDGHDVGPRPSRRRRSSTTTFVCCRRSATLSRPRGRAGLDLAGVGAVFTPVDARVGSRRRTALSAAHRRCTRGCEAALLFSEIASDVCAAIYQRPRATDAESRAARRARHARTIALASDFSHIADISMRLRSPRSRSSDAALARSARPGAALRPRARWILAVGASSREAPPPSPMSSTPGPTGSARDCGDRDPTGARSAPSCSCSTRGARRSAHALVRGCLRRSSTAIPSWRRAASASDGSVRWAQHAHGQRARTRGVLDAVPVLSEVSQRLTPTRGPGASTPPAGQSATSFHCRIVGRPLAPAGLALRRPASCSLPARYRKAMTAIPLSCRRDFLGTASALFEGWT